MAKKEVRAEDTFRINATNIGRDDINILPMTPSVEIQFKTNVAVREDDETPTVNNEWTTVSLREASNAYSPPTKQEAESSLKFDNYFENLTLEDSGGVVKCNMSLYDKDLERLENIIIKSIIATKGGNEVSKRKINEAPAKAILEFMPNTTTNINFRLRFGYSENVDSTRVFRPALTSSPEWRTRTEKEKANVIYLKSPWLYFMMMGLTFNLTNKGVVAQINGMSMSNTYLDKTKIIKRFALMEGNPQKLLTQIAEQIYIATAGRIQIIKAVSPGTSDVKTEPIVPSESSIKVPGEDIDYGEPSDLPIQWSVEPKDGEDTLPDNLTDEQKSDLKKSAESLIISVPLGGEPNFERDDDGRQTGKIINEFMSLRDLLRSFVSKVPPMLRNKKTNEYINDGERIKQIMNNKDGEEDPTNYEQIPYTFSVNEQTRDKKTNAETDTIVLVRFFYRRLDKTKQCFVKSYDYRQAPKTLVTGFNVKNKFDFIQLNQSIIVKGGDLDVMISAPPNNSASENDGSVPSNVTDYFHEQLNSDQFTLVNKIVENTEGSNSNTIASQVIKNMNEGIFFGDIEILGDPFYLFDSVVQPYQYFIKVNVYRNFNEYSNSNDKILKKSYLSGYYLVKKITHNLSRSGFRTTLSIEKYPTTGINKLKDCDN